MGRKRHVFPYENDVLPPEALQAARHILDQPTEGAYGEAFNAAGNALADAWSTNDAAGKEYWRLVFSAYVRLCKPAKWETEYHNAMTAAEYACPYDPRYIPPDDSAGEGPPEPLCPPSGKDDDIPF